MSNELKKISTPKRKNPTLLSPELLQQIDDDKQEVDKIQNMIAQMTYDQDDLLLKLQEQVQNDGLDESVR